MEPTTTNKLSTPVAIIIAGVIVAGAVLYGNTHPAPSPQAAPSAAAKAPSYAFDKMKPLNDQDHLRGEEKSAQIVVVEYSDLECPYCKEFHKTMQQVMTNYGGKVAWIYRHFPLNIHSQAEGEAEASECAAELGGNDKFWQFIDKVFATTPSNNRLDLALLPKFASEIGLDAKKFSACLESGRYSDEINKSIDDAVTIGAQGTPFSVIITKNGTEALGGYLPYEEMKEFLDKKLTNK